MKNISVIVEKEIIIALKKNVCNIMIAKIIIFDYLLYFYNNNINYIINLYSLIKIILWKLIQSQ